MDSCKNCIHQEACNNVASHIGAFAFFQFLADDSICKNFQAKEATIYLPCKIGATLYEVTTAGTVYKRYIEGYHCNTTGKKKGAYLITGDGMGMHSRININKLNKTVFHVPEDAEVVAKQIRDGKVENDS